MRRIYNMSKKTIKNGFYVLLAFLLFSGTGVSLCAQGYDGYYDDQAYTNPNLSQKQRDEIQKLEERLDAELSPMYQRLRTQYRELENMESAANPDARRIEKKWAEINRLEGEISEKELKHEQRIAKLLPEGQSIYSNSDAYGYPGAGLGYRSYYNGGVRLGRGPGGRGMGRLGGGVGYGIGAGGGYGTGVYGRLGRGPCGAGLGRLSGRAGYGAGRIGYGAGRLGYGGAGYGAGRVGYGAGRVGYGAGRMGYGRAGYGVGSYAYGNRNIYGGARMGPGPCGLGIGRMTAPRYSRRMRYYR